jgi:hypothetical protein
VSHKSDVQESLKLLDTKQSLSFVWKDSRIKRKSRNTNNDVSNRTRSKADYTYQHIGSRTRSKMHNINVNNLSAQKLFFPLHDANLFQGHGKSQAQDLQLGVVEYKVYHDVLMNTKSQVDFDRFLQLHTLDKTEEDKDIFLGNVMRYLITAKKKERSTAQIISVWWNGMMSIRLNHG